MDLKIKCIDGREIIDSRGNPTVEAQVYLNVVSLRWLLFPRERQPVFMRRWSFVTVTEDTTEKAF